MPQISGSLLKRPVGLHFPRGTSGVLNQKEYFSSFKISHVSKNDTYQPNCGEKHRKSCQTIKCGSTRGDKQQVKLDDFFDESTIEAFVPLIGYIVLFAFGAPLIGLALPSIGIVGLAVAAAYFTGQVEKISSAYGISKFSSALAIAGVAFSILAIPSLLKLGLFLVAALFALNFASNLIGTKDFSQSEDIDASNAIIDVDYESVDD